MSIQISPIPRPRTCHLWWAAVTAATMLTLAGCGEDPLEPAPRLPTAPPARAAASLTVTGADYNSVALPNPGSTLGYATNINTAGRVAGAVYGVLSNQQGYTDYLWTSASLAPTPVHACCGQAMGLNDHDQVVGYNHPFGSYEAYLWNGPGSSEVQFLGKLPGAAMSEAWAVNNHGAIVGESGADRDYARAVLWQPTT